MLKLKDINRVEGFNSRTPKGCDLQLHDELQTDKDVSIHAPLKGATQLQYNDSFSIEFQFTHP